MALYDLAILGTPTAQQIDELTQFVSKAVAAFGLQLGTEIGWSLQPTDFSPSEQRVAAVVFYGGVSTGLDSQLSTLLKQGVPIVPVASELERVAEEIPDALRSLNCISYNDSGTERIGTALLECAGLLPKQRRIFLSYRRDESRAAALQLFEELSARQFDVFLDTHAIAPAEDFQAMLWHRLSDSDVLLMLDTEKYFDSRWTNEELGKTQAKGISILRLGWPGIAQSPRVGDANQIKLRKKDLKSAGSLSKDIIQTICRRLESVRSQSFAMRNSKLINRLRYDVETIGGDFKGVGRHKSALILLPNGKELVVYLTIGVPTATTLHDAAINTHADYGAIIMYDHLGLHPHWQTHLNWLGSEITDIRWIKATEAAWHLADWDL